MCIIILTKFREDPLRAVKEPDILTNVKKVKVLKRIFFSEESGYGVFKVTVKGTREQTVMVGNLFDVNEGDFLEITGDEFTHPTYGHQIKVTAYKSILPEDREGMVKYLSSGRFKGLGKKTAEKIVNKFGDKTFGIFQDNPDRLREVKGVKKALIAEIKKSEKDNKTIRELTVKLAPYGIGNETVFKIYKTFSEDSFGILELTQINENFFPEAFKCYRIGYLPKVFIGRLFHLSPPCIYIR